MSQSSEVVDRISADVEHRAGPSATADTCFSDIECAGIGMLQKATRLMAEEISHDRWRAVTVRVTSQAVEMFRDSVSSFPFTFSIKTSCCSSGSAFSLSPEFTDTRILLISEWPTNC